MRLLNDELKPRAFTATDVIPTCTKSSPVACAANWTIVVRIAWPMSTTDAMSSTRPSGLSVNVAPALAKLVSCAGPLQRSTTCTSAPARAK